MNARLRARVTVLAALAVLGGCTSAPAFRGQERGPHAVVTADTVLAGTAPDRDIRVHIAAPAEAGEYPVVVFSHGANCFPDKYAAVTDHWVSHGYVVIAPYHVDSPASGVKLTPDMFPRLLDIRMRDLTAVTDAAAPLLAQAGLAARPDPSRMAIGGHSFGGMLTQVKAGLPVLDPATGATVSRADARYRAALVMSGVGQMPQFAPDGFAALRGPLLANGGTLDEGNVGSGQIFPWEWRMAAYDLAPPGDKYAVVLGRGDHYLGGLLCREDRGGDEDAEGAAIVRALQVDFLDAYVRGDAAARRFLQAVDVASLTAGRARYQRK